jgi:D-threonate/D-erythronate kinase
MSARFCPECLLLSDDLTGACDTGVQFARHGLSAEVWIEVPGGLSREAKVAVFNTDSRGDEPGIAVTKIQRAAGVFRNFMPAIVFKKIDSTLRGNVGRELDATIRLFDRSFAVVAPAFPGMQRVVQNGVLKWQDHFTAGKIDVGDLLEKQGIPRGQIWVADAVRRNASFVESAAKAGSPSQPRIVVADCQKQSDLEDLVSCTFPHRHRCLWVGSAGLGLALADKVGTRLSERPAPVLRNGSILFWIGSTHPVSSGQREVLVQNSSAVQIPLESGSWQTARRVIQQGRPLVVILKQEAGTRVALRRLLDGLRDLEISAMVLAGGDTASLVCKESGVETIRLIDEMSSGIAWGYFSGGPWDGLPVATKGGGFGMPDALLRCSEFFSSGRKQGGNA